MVVTINGKGLRSRRYDYIEEVSGKPVNVECKAWVPENVARRVKDSLKGTDEHGEQLMVDLLDWQKKDFTGNRWEFDSQAAVDVFKTEVLDVLRKNKEVRTVISGHLNINTASAYRDFVKNISTNIGSFVKAVE